MESGLDQQVFHTLVHKLLTRRWQSDIKHGKISKLSFSREVKGMESVLDQQVCLIVP